MASVIIHLCVAKKISEKLNIYNEKEFFLGAIAPDLNKHINESRDVSHFLTSTKKDIPNIQEFLNKYKDDLHNPYSLGYFVHLYTDKMWFDEFVPTFKYENTIKLKDNTVISVNQEQIQNIIYGDYSSLNIKLLDEINLDLSLFYEYDKKIKTAITEVNYDKIDILLEKMSNLLMDEDNIKDKSYVFDLNDIVNFIYYSCDKIIKKIYDYNIKLYQDN